MGDGGWGGDNARKLHLGLFLFVSTSPLSSKVRSVPPEYPTRKAVRTIQITLTMGFGDAWIYIRIEVNICRTGSYRKRQHFTTIKSSVTHIPIVVIRIWCENPLPWVSDTRVIFMSFTRRDAKGVLIRNAFRIHWQGLNNCHIDTFMNLQNATRFNGGRRNGRGLFSPSRLSNYHSRLSGEW